MEKHLMKGEEGDWEGGMISSGKMLVPAAD